MATALVLLLSSVVPSLALEWRGLPDCPPRADFLVELRRLRGEVLEQGVEVADVAVVISLERADLQWRARVETRSRAGVGLRILEADSCARAVDVAAVVVALALADPSAPPSPPPPPPQETQGNVGRLGYAMVGYAELGQAVTCL